jgi:outer membrane protein assembly factor BamE
MKKIVSALIMMCALSGCVHKMDIEQGNIVTQEMVNRIHTGMTMQQVKDIMGDPVLLNTFADNRVDYVYTFSPGYGNMAEKYITLTFSRGRLRSIGGNMYSQVMK